MGTIHGRTEAVGKTKLAKSMTVDCYISDEVCIVREIQDFYHFYLISQLFESKSQTEKL